ncbi:MAG: class I SAM-dependent methyltransferase [Salinivirgaceae bacterium]|jgi:SAM-dependent methyltransferase|nr:class I SAM-dependent methyltransferase [Salinivirgaceae bacterium]
MKVSVDGFFDLLLDEIGQNKELQGYYRFWDKKSSGFYFRKAYYCQRLQYIADNVGDNTNLIWDCGCGYGTTAIFLALNGYTVFGSTLEYYFEHIENRLNYWRQFGDLSNISFNYENIFDDKISAETYNVIIAQDTLHHLEPLKEAISILKKVLKPNGRLIAIEENGSNIIQNFKLFLQRGNKRIITIYDDKLEKEILLGNENIKCLRQWKQAFYNQELKLDENSVQYVRLFPPNFISKSNYREIITKEQRLWKQRKMLKNRFFFGLNFVVNN